MARLSVRETKTANNTMSHILSIQTGRRIAAILFGLTITTPSWAVTGLPGHIFSRDAKDKTTVLVDKNKQIAYLVKMDGDRPTTVKNYTGLLFGENNGDKLKEGDRRTPEGVYQVTSFIPDDKLDVIYGPGAFPLDYPNPLDRLEGRNGSGIWLHGRDDNDPKKQDTRGCVAFINNDIQELQGILSPETQVIISRDIDFVEPEKYQQERQNLLGTLDRYINAWEQGDFDTLNEVLHPNFIGSLKLNKASWLWRKKRLNKSYPKRKITTEDVVVLKEDQDQVVFDFTQLYCASNIVSRGKKRLFFKRDDGELKLITEEYSQLPAGYLVPWRGLLSRVHSDTTPE